MGSLVRDLERDRHTGTDGDLARGHGLLAIRGLIRPVVKRIGERRALGAGLACSLAPATVLALLLLALNFLGDGLRDALDPRQG